MVHDLAIPRVRQRRERNTEAILDAAMGIVATEGFEALTLQRVARECDYVPAALYRYFPSKDALVAVLQRRTVSDIHTRFLEARGQWDVIAQGASENVAGLVPIVGAARFYMNLPKKMPEAFRLVLVLLGDPRRLVSDEESSRARPLMDAFLLDVAKLFVHAESLHVLEPGDVRLRTVSFWALLQGTVQLEKLGRVTADPLDTMAIAMEGVTTLLKGWGAPGVSIHAARERLVRAETENDSD